MQGLSERVAWAIKIIARDKDLDEGITDVALAKILGTNKDTLATYRKGQGLLKGEVVENLVVKYNFSPQWLFRGEGEPFPGARAKYPEVCGPEAPQTPARPAQAASHVAPTSPLQQPPCTQSQEIRISDALSMTARVLESGTSYATALYLNIQHFDRAVQSETVMKQCQDDLSRQNKIIEEQRLQLADQERRITELENKIRYLTDLQEGSLSTAS